MNKNLNLNQQNQNNVELKNDDDVAVKQSPSHDMFGGPGNIKPLSLRTPLSNTNDNKSDDETEATAQSNVVSFPDLPTFEEFKNSLPQTFKGWMWSRKEFMSDNSGTKTVLHKDNGQWFVKEFEYEAHLSKWALIPYVESTVTYTFTELSSKSLEEYCQMINLLPSNEKVYTEENNEDNSIEYETCPVEEFTIKSQVVELDDEAY